MADHGLTIIQRLEKNRIVTENDCWEWTKWKDRDGYGSISIGNRNHVVSRVSYEQFVGSIPDGLKVLHTCDNPSCFNPKHLFLGTDLDNAQDRGIKDRSRNCLQSTQW